MFLLFEYHTFLHHSQTGGLTVDMRNSLSTIHFYIILKHCVGVTFSNNSLSTIHFYIILKRSLWQNTISSCLSTIHFYIILKPQIQK